MRGPLLATVYLTLAACGTPGQPESSHRSQRDPKPATEGVRDAPPLGSSVAEKPKLDQNQANEAIERALQRTARIRKLKPRGRVHGRVVTRSELVALVTNEVKAQVPRRVMLAQNEVLFALGTAAADFDYENGLMVLLEDQLAGLYNPKKKTMYCKLYN